MQSAAFEALGLPYCYLPFEVDPAHLKKAVEAVIPLGIQGLNLTIPHKEAIIPLLDQLTPEAEKIGAVNTVEVREGQLIGHNTDGRGFLSSLFEAEIDPAGMRVLLLGAGGAARGVAISLLSAGISEMMIIARNLARAEELAGDLSAFSTKTTISVRSLGAGHHEGFGKAVRTLLINATPLGMNPADPLPFPAPEIPAEWVVADLIYRPCETGLLLSARENGAKTLSGLGMLLHQGALAFEIWTKTKAPLEAMRKSLRAAFEAQGP